MSRNLPKGVKRYFEPLDMYEAQFTIKGRVYRRVFKTIQECLDWVKTEQLSIKAKGFAEKKIECPSCGTLKSAENFIRPDVGSAPGKTCNECFLPGRILDGDQWRYKRNSRGGNFSGKKQGDRFLAKKDSARRKGLPFSLSRDKFNLLKCASTCDCCGKDFGGATPQIDRIDNSLGYTDENCRALCWRCNTLKKNSNLEDLRRILAYIES